MTRLQKTGLVLGIGLGILFASVHFFLPPILLHKVNAHLKSVPGYTGQVKELELGWARPVVVFRDVEYRKLEETAPGAKVSAKSVTVRVSGRALLRRQWVADVTLEKPEMLFLMRERRVGQERPFAVWRKPFDHVRPFRVNQLTIQDGVLRFRNDDAIPPIDVYFNELDVTGTNFSNTKAMRLPGASHVEGRGKMMNHAPTHLVMKVEGFREHASFDIAGTLKNFDLTAMNPIMRFYTGLELKKGTLDMAMQMRVREGSFNGRVQRTIHDLMIQKKSSGLLNSMKEGMAQAWLNWHEDDKTEQIENDFEYTGPLGYLDGDVVLAGIWIVKGAFIQSLKASLQDPVKTQMPEKMLDEWAVWQEQQRKKAKRTD